MRARERYFVKYCTHSSVSCSVFADWRDFTMKRKEILFYQQQKEDKRSLTISFTHWRKMTKETRLSKSGW